MSRKKMKPKIENIEKKTVQDKAFHNGLDTALFGTAYSITSPFGPGAQVSQWDTMFENLRYYFVSNNRVLLSQIYAEIGLVKTIVDLPVDDGLRGGIKIKSKQLSEEEIQELETSIKRDDDMTTIGQSCKWNRLFGGAGILILTDQDPATPLDVEAINQDSQLSFRAVDMWELFWDKQNVEGYTPELQDFEFEFYNYYGKKLHKSRVLKLKGLQPPSLLKPRLRGWGLSEVETLVRSINQYLKAVDLGFEVLDEFKLDIYKLKDLANTLLNPQGENLVAQRVQTANRGKNFQNAIVLDSEDDYNQKQLSFAGLAEAMAGIRMQVASDMRMPITKLFGVSAAGFSSGEDDIENFNANIESSVRNKIHHHIIKVLELKCAKLFGFIPDDLSISFEPLRMLSAEQVENVKDRKFTRLMQAKQAGEISSLEFKQACNKDDLLGVQLDVSRETLEVEPSSKSESGPERDDKIQPQLKKNSLIFNEETWKEEKHPRDEDGQFAKSGSHKSTSDEPDSESEAQGEQIKPKIKTKFKKFETKDPERQNNKTDSIEKVFSPQLKGRNGKASTSEYKSPKDSTCNLVGFVAFGKAPKKVQEELNEIVQSSEVVLSDMGIRLKTPLDFVCQSGLSGPKNTLAEFIRLKNMNHRINIKAKTNGFSKSMLHEIGHAIDFALHEYHVPSSTKYTKHMKEDSSELATLHVELAKIVKESSFYKTATAEQKRYLEDPTEVFARAFEVHAYTKGLELVENGKLPESFIENFKPDVFKTLGEKIESLTVSLEELRTQRSKTSDEKELEELNTQIIQGRKSLEELKSEKTSFDLVPIEKQKDYMKKISDLMGQILSKDTIKNAINLFFKEL